jgi:hypothetical protein
MLFAVNVYSYGLFHQTIWIYEESLKSAETAVESLNLVDMDASFVLTGETKPCGK